MRGKINEHDYKIINLNLSINYKLIIIIIHNYQNQNKTSNYDSYNLIGDTGTKFICDGLSQLTQLQELTLGLR